MGKRCNGVRETVGLEVCGIGDRGHDEIRGGPAAPPRPLVRALRVLWLLSASTPRYQFAVHGPPTRWRESAVARHGGRPPGGGGGSGKRVVPGSSRHTR